jgi:hypothetical protein
MTLTVNREKHFIQVPFVSRSGPAAAQLIGIGLAEFATPIPHSFVRQGDPAFSHQLCDVTVAQAKAKVEPDAMTDDLRWEPMALVEIGNRWCGHMASMPHVARAGKVEKLI